MRTLLIYRLENCWPALAKDANGILLIYNPNSPQIETDLERWYVRMHIESVFRSVYDFSRLLSDMQI